MSELRDIVRIYDNLLKSKISKYIRSSFNEKEEKLFSHLQSNISDHSISKKLYNSSPSHQSYQSLKRGLLDKLYAIILNSNVGKSYQKQRLDTSRKFLVVKVLTVLKLRSIAIPLAEKTLKKCLKFHLYHEATELARLLSEHFSVFSKKTSKAREYFELALKCNDIYRLELEYGWKYSSYRSRYGTNAFYESLEEFKSTADELQGMFDLKSSRLLFYYFELRFFQYYITDDRQAMIDICKQAISHFRSLKFNHESARSIFIIHLIETYLGLRQLDKAESIILEFLDETDKKKAMYYRYKELLFCLYLYQADLDKARPIFEYLKKSIRRLSNIYTRDRLAIYEMYMHILGDDKLNFRKINYRLNKVKQDKKGLHVPYLIGQAVYFYMHEPDKLIDRMDALNQYAYKYLKAEHFERTRQFIKLLDKLIDGRYDVELILPEPDETINNHGIELVNYEKILEFMQARTSGSTASLY